MGGMIGPVNPSGKRPLSVIEMLEMSAQLNVIHIVVAEAGGEKKVIVAPVDPGWGSRSPPRNRT